MKKEMEIIKKMVDDAMAGVFLEHQNLSCKLMNNNTEILTLRIGSVVSSLAVGTLFADNKNGHNEDPIRFQAENENADAKLITQRINEIVLNYLKEAEFDDTALQNIIDNEKDFKFQFRQIFEHLKQE